MSKTPSSDTNAKAAQAASTLDALLTKAVSADQRANKPAVAPANVPAASPPPPPQVARVTAKSNPTLERLSVRFTQEEARLIEKARGVARAMGFKVSDTAVFRLALNAFRPETMTAAEIKEVLASDSRRKHG
jgi:hypothetical protein